MRLARRAAGAENARPGSRVGRRYGTAANIKSRVNRLSVLGAITSTQQRLKLYNRVPTNGLVREIPRAAPHRARR